MTKELTISFFSLSIRKRAAYHCCINKKKMGCELIQQSSSLNKKKTDTPFTYEENKFTSANWKCTTHILTRNSPSICCDKVRHGIHHPFRPHPVVLWRTQSSSQSAAQTRHMPHLGATTTGHCPIPLQASLGHQSATPNRLDLLPQPAAQATLL